MRLLNSATLKLEEFFDDHTPKYAILSHRWLNDEVSLQDMQDGTAIKKAGHAKLKLCCDQAAMDGLQYAWVDTCCIDKTSSAELTEAINSMYRWYQNATVCYAYLSDVQTSEVSGDASFGKSAWFTRGWTLQELIAPASVEFYNFTWQKLGTKESLKDVISEITNIDVAMLEGVDPEAFSVAKRMSWASKRTTTRPEDRAYSLLGLFEVNMPLLYGEGERAFIRLQEEIMKHSDDQSLFAWKSTSNGYRGLLAKSPTDFDDCYNVVSSRSKWNQNPYSVTNMGLSIELPMVAWAMETYLAALDCELENIPNSRIGIFLQLLPDNGQYARVLLDGTDTRTFESGLASKARYKRIYIRQKAYRPYLPIDGFYGFWIRTLPTKITTNSRQGGDKVSEVNSWNQWSDEDRILEIPTGSSGTAGAIMYRSKSGSKALKLGFDPDFNPVCQFGGHLFSPVDPPMNPQSIEAQMHPSWMLQRSDYLHKGDRLVGYNEEHYPYQISITDQTIGNRKMWVLDILDT
ncbi:heterokaryon incompatibility protein-domain-containing protein [Bisporella sp. PMI_857]|nr:heterokaryon incompatibility protein-domain-containing protein [Bisporella sp. PMI_857]